MMIGRKKFAVFDIDGTLIRWQLYHAVADGLVKLGYVNPGVYESMLTARMNWKTRQPGTSFRSYELELIRVYEEALSYLTPNQLDKAVDMVFNEYKDQVYTFTRQLIAQLKREGYFLLAVSGSQIEIVKLVANHYGFNDFVGTIYERAGDSFSGKKSVPSFDKANALKKLVKKNNLTFDGSVGIGDSLSDAAMLEMVRKPIAFNPDRSLFEKSREEGWKIVIERKNMIYEMELLDGQYQLVKTNAG